jgi:hypothetical protein
MKKALLIEQFRGIDPDYEKSALVACWLEENPEEARAAIVQSWDAGAAAEQEEMKALLSAWIDQMEQASITASVAAQERRRAERHRAALIASGHDPEVDALIRRGAILRRKAPEIRRKMREEALTASSTGQPDRTGPSAPSTGKVGATFLPRDLREHTARMNRLLGREPD